MGTASSSPDVGRRTSGVGRIEPDLPTFAVPLIDTHCHLSNQRFADDRAAVLGRMRTQGLCRAVCIATGLEDAQVVQALVAEEDGFLAWSVGLDPFSCFESSDIDADLDALRTCITTAPIPPCALGEIGLEYHHKLCDKPAQARHFAAQLDLAADLDLPVVIHCRDAFDDLIAILRDHPRSRGVIHSFIGTADHARAYLDLGWHLSFNGTVTFTANGFLREAAAIVPADRLLVETDAPYLAPMPLRGRRCEPAWVAHTARLLAEVRGERGDDLAAWTTRNACELFRLPLPW